MMGHTTTNQHQPCQRVTDLPRTIRESTRALAKSRRRFQNEAHLVAVNYESQNSAQLWSDLVPIVDGTSDGLYRPQVLNTGD